MQKWFVHVLLQWETESFSTCTNYFSLSTSEKTVYDWFDLVSRFSMFFLDNRDRRDDSEGYWIALPNDIRFIVIGHHNRYPFRYLLNEQAL